MSDTKKLLLGLKEYSDSLEKHLASLRAEYEQLENSWKLFNSVAEGDYAEQFRGGWLRTANNFQEYINYSYKIQEMLKDRIADLELVNQINSEI